MNIEKMINELLGQREIFGFFNRVQELDNKLDEYFGIELKEDCIQSCDDNLYAGLEMGALSTSYLDYYQVLKNLELNSTLLDIGSGYCRGTFLAKELGYDCLSLEVDKSRSSFAKAKYPKDVLQIDLREEIIPKVDSYFIYLPWGELTNSLLKTIYERNVSCYLYVIESHGDFVENLNLYKEFKSCSDIMEVSSRRHKNYIYKYEFIPSNLYTNTELSSFKDQELIPYWILKYQDQINRIKISSKTLDQKLREWVVDFKLSYACIYNSKESIYLPTASRYLQYQDDTIIDISL